MYIFGEAPLLASRSQMWRSVIDELESIGCIGAGVPISCQRHPDEMNLARKPGEIRQYAPDGMFNKRCLSSIKICSLGGCLRACESRLQCGHMCTYKCHSDDPGHAAVRCIRDCARLCPLGHPCNKECAQECGSCNFPTRDVTIPSCGHVILETTWYVRIVGFSEISNAGTSWLQSFLSSPRTDPMPGPRKTEVTQL